MVGRIDLKGPARRLIALLLPVIPGSHHGGTARKRAEVFKKCLACQDIGPTAKNKVGFPRHGHPLGARGLP